MPLIYPIYLVPMYLKRPIQTVVECRRRVKARTDTHWRGELVSLLSLQVEGRPSPHGLHGDHGLQGLRGFEAAVHELLIGQHQPGKRGRYRSIQSVGDELLRHTTTTLPLQSFIKQALVLIHSR